MHNEYLFVYGTLRRDCSTGAHETYLQGAEFIARAKLRGRLYRVSYYPALVLDINANWVLGEVYRLRDSQQLQVLDRYEECTYPPQAGQEYQRRKADVQTDGGERLNAWIYVYQRVPDGLQQIHSGDFLAP